MSFAFSNDHNSVDPDAEFKHVEDGFNSSFKWAVSASIISGLVITVAIVAVVYVLIDCLKKTGTSFLRYKGIPTKEFDQTDLQMVQSEHHGQRDIEMPQSQPVFPVVRNSQVEFATMERFICEIANEKPIRFSSEQLDAFTNNYSTILGSGGYGVVFKGAFPNGIPVAVKILTESQDKRIAEQFMAEVNTIGRTYHINLVRLYGFCYEPNTRALVYEFMENGSLDNLLFDKNRDIEWEKLREIAIGVAKGIAYLHEECRDKIIHYDIKPENILLDGDLRPKVADFGLAKLCNVETSKITMTGCRGTPGYAAPEMWEPFPVSHKCDVYSFGILLFEILGRRRHHDANEKQESQQWLPRWTWDAFSNNELPVMLSLCGIDEKSREKALRMALTALWCVQNRAEKRPSMSSVVKMLEEGMEIERPPNPFKRFERIEPSSPAFGSDDRSSSSDSSYIRTYKEPTRRASLEIEFA